MSASNLLFWVVLFGTVAAILIGASVLPVIALPMPVLLALAAAGVSVFYE